LIYQLESFYYQTFHFQPIHILSKITSVFLWVTSALWQASQPFLQPWTAKLNKIMCSAYCPWNWYNWLALSSVKALKNTFFPKYSGTNQYSLYYFLIFSNKIIYVMQNINWQIHLLLYITNFTCTKIYTHQTLVIFLHVSACHRCHH